MNIKASESKEYILETLVEQITHQIPEKKAKLPLQFAQKFYYATPENDLQKWRADDLLGATMDMWYWYSAQGASPHRVKVINPDFERNGFQSSHTMIYVTSLDRPFIVDSLRLEIIRKGLSIHAINNMVIQVERNAKGQIISFDSQKGHKESVICIEVDRHTSAQWLETLTQELSSVLDEVKWIVDDFEPMLAKVDEQIDHLKNTAGHLKEDAVNEAIAFLDWMRDHFTFLGYEVYDLALKSKEQLLVTQKDSGLGLLNQKNPAVENFIRDSDNLNADQHNLLPDLISFTKAANKSRIHRPAYPDYISFKRFNKQGKQVGEVRFLGLYTSAVYLYSPRTFPVIRGKIQAIAEKSGLTRMSHDWKELLQVLETFPRDELFQMSIDELSKVALSVMQIRERRQIRVFIRRDTQGCYFSVLVYVPREIYSTDFRIKAEEILKASLQCELAEFTTYFSESILARTQFNLRKNNNAQVTQEFDVHEIERKIRIASRSWKDDLFEVLVEAQGEEHGIHHFNRFGESFPAGYKSHYNARSALVDIQYMSTLHADKPLELSFYRAINNDEDKINLKLYNYAHSLPLSDVIPILENLGLRVLDEHPYQILAKEAEIWIHDFTLSFAGERHASLDELETVFKDAFMTIWQGMSSSDSFNRLVLGAGLSWREIKVLRAYAAYMKQIRFPLSTDAVMSAMNNHTKIAKALVQLFEYRFDPQKVDATAADKIQQTIVEMLDLVSSLNEDQVIRQYLVLINATLRTNFYQKKEGQLKHYISFKLSPADIPGIPLPRPMFEIFVYSNRVEGVHLRGGKVARGGLRWSDRHEDFRTEVLGLVKAQQVKNAVIVPVGAKGGFVAKKLHPGMTRDAWLEEGIRCYKMFISALLDITDNLVEGQVVPPQDVVRHDVDDTYLVVAADKGTATFSDIANSIAQEYGFWLGDAFASGGSQGYDHKKMGITAKGAWVSVERHFREMGHNTRTQPFTVLGIGDMSGDVFGNGMLLSNQIKLVAAFNHLHIFIDPNPDTAKSYAERERLFVLPRSGWADYDKSLISKGGGVFERSAKSIKLTPEIKKLTGLTQEQITPNDLISALLKAEIDLIWNGGIGTYIKASHESHADVGDKANDGLRVNAKDLRARVVGEGGNLGMTQLGRIEYGRLGGKLFTDFIDNAGGVDCSDHEVNIKILLNGLVASGDMTLKQRNKLLEEMTDQVSSLVLSNNYRQTQAISLARRRSEYAIAEFQRFITQLESQGKLDRGLEFLPGDEIIEELRIKGLGLSTPELSILISYSKADLKEQLLDSDLPDDPYVSKELMTAFPQQMRSGFAEGLKSHRLCREIVATQVANEMVNLMGISFSNRLSVSTGAKIGKITRAYVMVRDIFKLQTLWQRIEDLDYSIDATVQLEMMERLQYLARHATRWFLRNRIGELDCQQDLNLFAAPFESVFGQLEDVLYGEPKEQWQAHSSRFIEAGVPVDLANIIAGTSVLASMLSLVEVAKEVKADIQQSSQTFFAMSQRLQLHWYNQQLNALKVESYWQALARDAFRDDLDLQLRTLLSSLLSMTSKSSVPDAVVARWCEHNQILVERWDKVISDLRLAKTQDYAMYTVAGRELHDLARNCYAAEK